MKDKKHTTESAQATYQTGSTQPPKSRVGIIAFLLVLVIFLSGISTALGLMNIRLFQKLNAIEETEAGPVVFSRGAVCELPESVTTFPLGFAGQEVPLFWQTYHHLPAGIYVVEVTDDSNHPLLPGDILTELEGTALNNAEDFLTLLSGYLPDREVTVTVYRGGNYLSAVLTIKED